jgi:hypothetical protein
VKIAFAAVAAVALLLPGCTRSAPGSASSAPSVTSSATLPTPSTSASASDPSEPPTDVPVPTQAGDGLRLHQSGTGSAQLHVPQPSKGTASLLIAIRCDKGGSVDLRTKGRALLTGDKCDNRALYSVRSPLSHVNVQDVSIRVNPGTTWQAWIWSGTST